MNLTYFYQRQIIAHSKCVGNILLDWPFIGEVMFVHNVELPSKASIPVMATHFFSIILNR